MFQGITQGYQRLSQRIQSAALLALAGGGSTAHAALPTVTQPTNAAGSGNYLGMIKAYSAETIVVIGLILAASVFVLVVKNAMTVYSEIGTGKKQWSDLAMHVTIGGILLVVAVYLLTESKNVI